MDIDIQSDTDNDGDKSAVVVPELVGQITGIGEQDTPSCSAVFRYRWICPNRNGTALYASACGS